MFRYAPFQHDDGEKKFFGQTGNLIGDDIVDMILEKPACSKYIAKKIWAFFAYEDPAPALVDALADQLSRAQIRDQTAAR